MTRVLIADPLGADGIALMQHRLAVTVAGENDVASLLPGSEALIVRSRTRVTDDLLARGDDLRLVARAGIGVDNIDVDAATRRGILVVNAPYASVRSAAEHTLALMLAAARRLPAADAGVRSGAWRTGYSGTQLAGKTLGVIGAGKIGRQVALLGAAIGMDVMAHDPYLPPAAWNDLGLTSRPLDDLLAVSDVVTLHIPLLPETRHLLDETRLARMKSGAILVNCARGGLVDEAAVAVCLADGHLSAAAFDVFEDEPPAGSPLLTAPNVVLTPHVAASTREAQAHVSVEIAHQVLDYFAGRPVAHAINPSVLGVS
ncbi:MAG TPA: hydroxyacid dehydrogenase [Chloroflexota bacterium]|nr:hydroxyacid dehydrogenase [Chloroflexota bacterium]